MERSVGEHATESTQPCRKGAKGVRISALEAVYEEYELIQVARGDEIILHSAAAGARKAVRPSPLEEVPPARFLVLEPL